MQPSHITLKRNTHLLPILVGLLLLTYLALPHTSWLTLLVGLSALWLISYFWARALANSLTLDRQVRFGWAQVGDQLEERFMVSNRSMLPALWLDIVDHSTLPGSTINKVQGIDGHSTNQWKIQRPCTQRGVFTLGPTTLRSGDPFGLYTITIEHPNTLNLTVTPPVVPLPTIEVAPGGRGREGYSHHQALERTVSVEGIRPYIPGDPLRAIHWPTSAKHNSLFVHRFQNTPASDWLIVLDLAAAVQVGSGQTSTLEHSIILAASLAAQGLRAGQAVGLIGNGVDLIWLPPRTGEHQRWQMLQALALAQPGPHSLAHLLYQLPQGQSTSLVVITPDTSHIWLEALAPLHQHGAVTTAMLLDPKAFGGEGDIKPSQHLLSEWGIAHHHITPDLLDRSESRPGKQGQWKWQVSPLGRAVSQRPAREMTWRSLR